MTSHFLSIRGFTVTPRPAQSSLCGGGRSACSRSEVRGSVVDHAGLFDPACHVAKHDDREGRLGHLWSEVSV